MWDFASCRSVSACTREATMDSNGGGVEKNAYEKKGDEKRIAVKDLMAKLRKKLEATLKDGHFRKDGVYHLQITLPWGREEKEVWIVNPLNYAADYFDKYIDLIQDETKVLFVGMNSARSAPTGIPYHQNDALEKMFKGLQLDDEFLKCMGSESIQDSESGEIFWRGMEQYFGSSEKFFHHCFVINYCPLIFVDERRNINIPLSEFDEDEPLVTALEHDCHDAFQELVKILNPKLIVAIGTFAKERVGSALKDYTANHNLRSIRQPISFTYEEGDSPLQEKIEMWKDNVDERLAGNSVWEAITKGKGYSAY